jgi:orotate phosphoribosyltransferase
MDQLRSLRPYRPAVPRPVASKPVTDLAQSRTRLGRLLADNAVIHESVLLSSGRRSPYYIDCRQVLLDPEGAELAGALGWDLLAATEVQAVGGLTLGADPLVCAVSAAAWSRSRRVTGFFIRKEAKKHGLQQWLEGPFIEEGTPVAVVDDVLTSGGSLGTAIEKARQAGGVVVAAIVVIDREEGGRETIEQVLDGAPLHALFTANELLSTDS